MIKLSISGGNSKMGSIPSVSLPPIKTCRADAPCTKKCYAARLVKRYKNVSAAYENNLKMWEESPEVFELQVVAAAIITQFFRWHVAGDILNDTYFKMMCSVAKRCPGTKFLAFTKRWDIVNPLHELIPKNLQIVYSAWPGLEPDNPYDLPVAHIVLKGEEPKSDWKICGGNCTECVCRGIGCWELKHGEHIAFYEH